MARRQAAADPQTRPNNLGCESANIKPHNSYGDGSFAATGLHLWNSLPQSYLRHSDIGYNNFKRQLNTFLFRQTAVQRIVTLALCALYKYSYLLTYLCYKRLISLIMGFLSE